VVLLWLLQILNQLLKSDTPGTKVKLGQNFKFLMFQFSWPISSKSQKVHLSNSWFMELMITQLKLRMKKVVTIQFINMVTIS